MLLSSLSVCAVGSNDVAVVVALVVVVMGDAVLLLLVENAKMRSSGEEKSRTRPKIAR